MRSLLLSPHNDDEVLWTTWTLLREKPYVVVCLRSHSQGDNFAQRELETAAAMQVLGGCSWEQWTFADSSPDWVGLRRGIEELADVFEHCYAPCPRFVQNGHDPSIPSPPGGIFHHDKIGEFARGAFKERCTLYTTYTRWGGKDEQGEEVPYEPEWPLLKLQALACYKSQIIRPEIVPHFLDSQKEFYAQ